MFCFDIALFSQPSWPLVYSNTSFRLCILEYRMAGCVLVDLAMVLAVSASRDMHNSY